MATATYISRRGELETYFDRTAVEAWKRLTSDAPVGRIRATVRAGRDEMRRVLLSWLPDDMTGLRLLDAGCGTGAPTSSPSTFHRRSSTSPENARRAIQARANCPSPSAICSTPRSVISIMSSRWIR
jgi:hypothetical protein